MRRTSSRHAAAPYGAACFWLANPDRNPDPNPNASPNPTLHSRTLLLLGLPGGSGPGDVRPSSSHLAAEAGPLLVCQWGVDMTLVRARPTRRAPHPVLHPVLQRTPSCPILPRARAGNARAGRA